MNKKLAMFFVLIIGLGLLSSFLYSSDTVSPHENADIDASNEPAKTSAYIATHRYGVASLHAIAKTNDVSAMDAALAREDADINASNEYGLTPLWIATLNEEREMVKFLLEKGANPNAGDGDYYKRTPLHIVVLTGNVEIATLLLDHEATINLGDRYGRTPLYIAVESGGINTAQLLLNRHADANIPNNRGIGERH